MSLVGNDFVPRVYTKPVHCSECGAKFPTGTTMLVSVRKGKVRKIVCGEECRKTFDDRFWRSVARRRNR